MNEGTRAERRLSEKARHRARTLKPRTPTPELPADRLRTLTFDLRSHIAAMFTIFGVMLTVYGAFFIDEPELKKSGGVNVTLGTGVGMLVVAALFFAWAWFRPAHYDDPAPEIEREN